MENEEERLMEAVRLLPLIEPYLPPHEVFKIQHAVAEINLNTIDAKNAKKLSAELTQLLVSKKSYILSNADKNHLDIQRVGAIIHMAPVKRKMTFSRMMRRLYRRRWTVLFIASVILIAWLSRQLFFS